MTGKIMPLRERDTSTIPAAAGAFLSSPRYANPNTRRGYTGVLDRLLAGLGASRPLAEVSGEELAGLLEQLWGQRAPATWNRNRGAVTAWLSWCAASRLPAPVRPASAERRREHLNATRAVPRPAIDRALTRRDVPLREKTLWRMLYETAARASEVLALNIEDLGLDARRTPDPLQGRRHRMDLLGLRHGHWPESRSDKAYLMRHCAWANLRSARNEASSDSLNRAAASGWAAEALSGERRYRFQPR